MWSSPMRLHSSRMAPSPSPIHAMSTSRWAMTSSAAIVEWIPPTITVASCLAGLNRRSDNSEVMLGVDEEDTHSGCSGRDTGIR